MAMQASTDSGHEDSWWDDQQGQSYTNEGHKGLVHVSPQAWAGLSIINEGQ